MGAGQELSRSLATPISLFCGETNLANFKVTSLFGRGGKVLGFLWAGNAYCTGESPVGGNPVNAVDPLGLQVSPTDNLIYPPETNCSFTIDCRNALLGDGMVGGLTLGVLCSRTTGVPVISGILCNATVWMVCGEMSKEACKGKEIPIKPKKEECPKEDKSSPVPSGPYP